MSLHLLHGSDSKSTSFMLASIHLPVGISNQNLRLPHSYSLAAYRWLWYNGFPPKPPIPPDPPPSPSPMTRSVNRHSKPPLSHTPAICNDVVSYFSANHQNKTKSLSLTRTHHISLTMATIRSPTLLPPLRLHIVYVSSLVSQSRSEQQELLLHAITSTTSVLLKLLHLRPPANRSRNGNRGFSDLASSYAALKTAISAVSTIEIQHMNVFSDSQSLASLVISSSDVNELRSVLVDIRSLLETFSCISVFYIPCSANVVTDGLILSSALVFPSVL